MRSACSRLDRGSASAPYDVPPSAAGSRLRAVPLDIEAARGAGDRLPGRFSLTTERFFRVRDQREGTTIYRDAPAGPAEARPPVGGDADGPPKPPAAKAAFPASYPLTQ